MTPERLDEIRRTVHSSGMGGFMPSAMGAELLAELDRVAEHTTVAARLAALERTVGESPPNFASLATQVLGLWKAQNLLAGSLDRLERLTGFAERKEEEPAAPQRQASPWVRVPHPQEHEEWERPGTNARVWLSHPDAPREPWSWSPHGRGMARRASTRLAAMRLADVWLVSDGWTLMGTPPEESQ